MNEESLVGILRSLATASNWHQLQLYVLWGSAALNLLGLSAVVGYLMGDRRN